LKPTVPIITDAHVLQTFFTPLGYGELLAKTSLGPKSPGAENVHHDATTFNWTMFSCWYEKSYHKLQNISSSMSAIL